MDYLEIVITVLSVCLGVSEALPLTGLVKSNSNLQLGVNVIKGIYGALTGKK